VLGFAVNELRDDVQLVPLVHIHPGCDDPGVRKVAVEAAEALVPPCMGRGRDAAIETNGRTAIRKFCLVRLVYEHGATGPLRAAIAIIARCLGQEEAMARLEKLRERIGQALSAAHPSAARKLIEFGGK